MRFTFCCRSAPRLPIVIESAAISQSSVRPLRVQRREDSVSNAQQHGKRRGLRRRRHQRDHRRRSALIHIRRPHLERRGRNLEADPDQHHRQRNHGKRGVAVIGSLSAISIEYS